MTGPAKLLKIVAKGPWVPIFKNPSVGDIPINQDLSLAVVNPNPNNLSINAHKKIQPIPILNNAQIKLIFSFFTMIIFFFNFKNLSFSLFMVLFYNSLNRFHSKQDKHQL